MKKQIYLDYAAATPIDKNIKKLMADAQGDYWANPSSMHSLGKQSSRGLEDARKSIAGGLGAKPTEIIFTSGSTESANMAILGIGRQYPQARIVATAIEHEVVLNCLRSLDKNGRFTAVIPAASNGIIELDSVLAAIDDMTVLVCVMYANNEIGTIQPIAKISQVIAKIRVDRLKRGITMPIYLYCDAAQAGLLTLSVSRLGVDLMSMGGSKMYGPRHSGFLYVRTGVAITPIFYGGGQEGNTRSGTPDVPSAVGLAASLQYIQQDRAKEDRRQSELSDSLWNMIQKSIPGARLNGDKKQRLSGNLNVYLPGVSGETLVAYMDSEGICIATGSACTAVNEEPSHVLLAIGLTPARAESSVRITLGRGTTKADIEICAEKLTQSIAKLYAHKK